MTSVAESNHLGLHRTHTLFCVTETMWKTNLRST